MPGNAFQYLRDPAYMFNWLDYQTHGASAGQLEALGFFARQTVGQHLAMVGRQLPTLRAQGEVVLDAAAGYRTNRQAITAQGQHGSRSTRAGTTGLHHR